MTILIKNKDTLKFNYFSFKCSIGAKGKSKNKQEGDKKTPIGTFSLGNVYYRKDRKSKPQTKLSCIPIRKNMGWCNDIENKNYKKLIKIKKTVRHEKMFRKDYKYDLVIVINYNSKKIFKGRGSAIFIHLTKKYKPTAGCIALKEKDFLILLKVIKRDTRIKII